MTVMSEMTMVLVFETDIAIYTDEDAVHFYPLNEDTCCFFTFEDTSHFCGATDTPFWIYGDVSSGFQSQCGQPYLLFAYV